MKHSMAIPVALMAIFAMATPALGMRPIGRGLLADEAPAPEQEALFIDFVPEAEFFSPEAESLARGYNDRGSNWRRNDYNRNDNNYNYNYNDNNRREYDYNDNDRRNVIIIAVPAETASKVLAIDPWKLGQQYPDQTASVGDSITFKWSGTHGVYRIPSGTCPSDFTPSANNGIIEIQAPKADGTAEYKFTSKGTYWFACPVGSNGAHCNNGMKVKVVVS